MSAAVDARRAMLAKIHIAAKRLALEDESYRALVKRVTGRESAGDCDLQGLDALLREFRKLGFDDAKRRSAFQRVSEKAYVRLIYALWGELEPHLREPSSGALRSFVKRQTGLSAPEFLGPEQANRVIEGLKAWLARVKQDARRAD
ncbi:MAG: phage protein GemA/Gp16 family protein [Steroidobacteraceae bacterium]